MLTVASVGYPLAPAGRDAVGGSEQVLAALDRALVAAGHRSIVIAPEGSVVAGELVAIPEVPAVIDEAARARAHEATRAAIASVLREHAVDLVHLHGIDFNAYMPPPGPAVLVTLHLPLDWYAAETLRPERPDTWLHGVSETQYRAAPANACLLPPIANGVDVAGLGAVQRRRCGYALMLGRVCPEKGQHLALQAAHAADVPLLIGGQVFPYETHRRYFEEEVAPLLNRRRRYLGPLGFLRKRRLLAGARCVLVPSLAQETASLVAMEAAACGTPVIAFPNGALPDVVEHGRTGFLVRDVAEMAQAIRQAPAIDSALCRETAQVRFSLDAMTHRYLALYAELARVLVP
jgi:glycosyltransferase involved in cell wall biosynthesis